MLLGQSRIFWTMADDGLLPKFVSRVHPKFQTPWITTIVTGIVVACFAAIFTVREAGSLVSIGTLLAFVIVSIGVLVLRIREPNLPRTFKTPAVWFVAPMGVLSAVALMISLPWLTWERLIYWFAFGIVIYFGYGVYNSKLGPRKIAGETGWSRALKIAGVIWIVFGSLGSILWLARYRTEYIPGTAWHCHRTGGVRARVEFGRVVEPGRPSFRPYACTSLDDGITGRRGEIGEHERTGSRAGFASNPRTGLVAANRNIARARRASFSVSIFLKSRSAAAISASDRFRLLENLCVGPCCLVRLVAV